MVKKDNYFTCFIFFCTYTLLVCGQKTILPRSRSRSRVFLDPKSRSRSKKIPEPEPEPLGKKNQEPEPLKNLPAPQPCKKIKSIRKLYFSYSFLGKILSFVVKNENYFTCFIFFFTVLPYQFAEKRLFCQGAGAGRSRVLLAPWSRSRSKKNTRSRSRLGKKIRSRSR